MTTEFLAFGAWVKEQDLAETTLHFSYADNGNRTVRLSDGNRMTSLGILTISSDGSMLLLNLFLRTFSQQTLVFSP